MPAAAQTITATYVNIYVLTVNSGSGDGTYTQGTVVNIAADTAPSGYQFSKWIGNTSGIANVNAASTTLTMPAAAQTVTATYAAITYTLTVNSGTGDGNYTAGTVVNIAADAAPSGKTFDKWIGNTSGIANVNSASTTLTMPAAAQTITATYKDITTTYTLTVNGGTGGGSYTQGTVVNIAANTAASGQFFDKWTGNTSGIANINASSTTLTMPAANQTITSTYASVAGGLVSRFTFDIDARDSIGSNNGTLTGGALVANDATRGSVLSLDGTDDYVSLPLSGMAAGRSEVTLSVWVRPDTWVSGDTLYDEAADGPWWQFTLAYDGYCTRDSSTGTEGTRDNDVAMPSLTTGQWQHLAVTYSVSGAKKQVFLNGVPGASSTTSIDALTSSRTGVGIGYASDGGTFDGLVDDVRLYNRALNTTEIAVLAGTTTYTLTVNSGSGDGNYTQGTVVNISADTAPSGKTFDKWTGNTSGIANVNAASTTLTMPAAAQTITATYVNVYVLTVNSGSGDGSYTQGTVVNISADAAPSGKTFDKWTGNTSGIANVNASSTTLTMPAAAQTITATYKDQGATLIANYGSSPETNVLPFEDWTTVFKGAYTTYQSAGPAGISGGSTGTNDVVRVSGGTAHAFAVGDQIIATWYNCHPTDTFTFTPKVSFTDTNEYDAGSTWYDMSQIASMAPGETRTCTYTVASGSAGSYTLVNVCRYTSLGGAEPFPLLDKVELMVSGATYTLTVNSGSGDGSYTQGTVVNISADAAPSGKVFDKWTGNTSGIANVNASSTTLTMPAANQTITATYVTATTYTLTVNSGSGDGNYTQGTVVSISADAPPSGKVFDKWVGNTSGIANVNASSTTLTMPAANQTITATYVDAGSGPSVSGVSGTIAQRSTITISGSNFGSAPTVVVFDDFEGGTNGNTIPTGAGSALIGQWDEVRSPAIYSNTTAVSGSLSFRAEATDPFGLIITYLPANTRDVFLSWWMYIPSGDNLPGEGTPDHTNWKVMWVLGADTTDDDLIVPGIMDGPSYIISGNDSPYTKWPDIDFQKGEWKRLWVWAKGGYDNDGQCHFWELDSTNAVLQRVNDNNVTIMYPGGIREQVNVNGYDRVTPNCHPTFDDVYIAAGSNARARVEIGNSSTYNNCTQLAVCPSTSWSGTSITAKCNLGGLSGSGWYLFVIDASGNVSSGYLVN